jgi:hypothetical protein
MLAGEATPCMAKETHATTEKGRGTVSVTVSLPLPTTLPHPPKTPIYLSITHAFAPSHVEFAEKRDEEEW